MENQIFKDINTELDLNGPYLSFSSQPTDQTPATGASVSFVGLATASYGSVVGGTAENIGTMEYQWYEVGVGALSDGGNISGATTRTLTLATVTSGTDDNREFYLAASYLPSQLDYESGNPSNEPLNSDTVGMTIQPNIQIISQPSTRRANTNTSTTFTVDADLTSGTTTGLLYQWYVDGVAETNRTKETTVTGSTTVASPHNFSWTGDANHTLPTTAYDITTTIAAASGGAGGNDSGGSGAPGGKGKGGNFSLNAPSVQGKTLQFRIGSSGNPGPNGRYTYGAGGIVSGPASNQTKNINFVVNQSAGCSNEVVFAGHTFPSRRTGNHSVPITANTDYNVTASGSCGQSWLQIQSGGTRLGLDDSKPGGDNDYNDLTVSASEGKFNNANRTTANYRWTGGTSGGTGSGTRGGGSGHRGWSGGGGGAGAASYVKMDPGGYIIVAGGGAGGGGGSWNRGGVSNSNIDGRPFSAYPSPVPLSSGQPTGDFDHSGGDGGGSGGGGGGSPGGATGNRGWDKNHGGRSGNGGGSRFDDPIVDLTSQFNNSGNGYASLSYMSTQQVPTSEIRRTVISGVNTPTLTLKSDYTGVQNVYCVVSHPTAGNSPQTSDTVTFTTTTTPVANTVNIESIDLTTSATLQSVDLTNGDVTFDTVVGLANLAGQQNVVCLYAPDKDIDVQMDLYGGAGRNESPGDPGRYSNKKGGEGGYSRIEFTLTKNQEYTIAGLSTFIGAPAIYRGATLIANVGQGGGAGDNGDGGDGGGCNISGQKGLGAGAGNGGTHIHGPRTNGKFGSNYQSQVVYTGDQQGTGTDGGMMIACPKGVYWRQQGKAQCSSVGTVKYRLSNGNEVTNTSNAIVRGYKSGYNIIQTAGGSLGGIGGAQGGGGGTGGNGYTGGDGGEGGGGGGGSGYADTGVVTVKDAELGGSTGYAKVVLRLKT